MLFNAHMHDAQNYAGIIGASLLCVFVYIYTLINLLRLIGNLDHRK